MRNLFYFFVLLLSILLLSCETNQIILAENGKTNYEIIYANDASETEKNAALLLANYLQQITGANFKVEPEKGQHADKHKIYIGQIKDNKKASERIAIYSDQMNVYITGGSVEAKVEAVYVFIEEFMGVKWFAPDAEFVPNEAELKFPKDLSYDYIPPFTTRTVHARLFYDDSTFADKLRVTHNAFPGYVPTARVHTFHKFLPHEKFYKNHPEYYALRNGKRLPTQLCLTNEAVLNIVKDSVASLFKQFPQSKVISVSQDDNTGYCQCENCTAIDTKEESPAGTIIHFVNKIAENFPDKTISTLAYQHTRKPPKTIKPLDNVLITLCSIECDRSESISKKCKDFAKDLKGWSRITDNIRIWDYTTQFTNFLAPFPNLRTLQANIQLFRDDNAKWVFEQHSYNPSELFELRAYVTAKLLWNPNADFDKLISEFTDGYYEEAGEYVKKYIDHIHRELEKHPDFFLFLYGDPSQAFDKYLNPKLLAAYEQYFNDAEKAVAQKPQVLQRVKEARLGVDFAILEMAKQQLDSTFSLTVVQDGKKIENPYIRNKLEAFYSTVKLADIQKLNEMGYTFKEYYQGYKKAIAVATQPNKAKGKKVTLLTQPKKYANEDPQTLTDGALGGNNFYANWLGFEGNDMEAVIDLETEQEISSISTAFLQVTNHVVFYPLKVSYYFASHDKNYKRLTVINNDAPLNKNSKVNDIKYYRTTFPPVKAQYIKIVAKNMKTAPYWHHAAGLPAWIFTDEIIVN